MDNGICKIVLENKKENYERIIMISIIDPTAPFLLVIHKIGIRGMSILRTTLSDLLTESNIF